MGGRFPRVDIGGVSVSRMIVGTNWMLGYSHTSPAADAHIKEVNPGRERIAEIIVTFLQEGVDTVMGPFRGNAPLIDGAKLAEDKSGRRVIRIDTPIINVDDSTAARREAEGVIRESASLGAVFCLPHHTSGEQLVNKNARTITRLPDYLTMIRAHGMIPGLSAHMPEMVVYSDSNGYDVETYIQIYNPVGFLMQVEVEYVHAMIWGAKKPVMAIKPMAAGRVSPFVGPSFAFGTLRPRDCVTVGCLTPGEAGEDIEIGLAAIERRPPALTGRDSPNKTSIMKEV
jgi:hypothetical protein